MRKIKEDGFFLFVLFYNPIQSPQMMGPAHLEISEYAVDMSTGILQAFQHGLARFSLLSVYKKTSIGGVSDTPTKEKEYGLLGFFFENMS